MKPVPRELIVYQLESGVCPFEVWINSLEDSVARAIIRTRLNRVRLGNFGHCRRIEGRIFELKISFGPGYRVYCVEDDALIVVLLIGGDKGSQKRDIQKAKKYWEEYNA